MGREGDDDDDEGNNEPNHKTLSFAEFVKGRGPRPGGDCGALVLGDSSDGSLVFPLTRNPTVVGRSKNADLVLTDPAISDFHARILRHSFGYTVEDLGSAEGTFLGDRRVKHARLINGDTLRLGPTALTFLHEQASSPKGMALVPVRGTVRGLATRQTLLRDQHAPPGDLKDAQPLPYPTPARRKKPADSEDAAPSLDDVLLKIISAARFIQRNSWLLLTFAITGLGLGAASFKYYPPVRSATCTVTLFSAPKTNPIAPEARSAQSDSTHFFVGAERTVTSLESIMATLKRLGIAHPTDEQAKSIAKRMRFEKLDFNTYLGVMTPKLLDRRDESHVKFLDAHIQTYVETEIDKKLKVFVAEVDFLRSQTEAADKRLQDISRETVQFREAHADQILAQNALGSSPGDLETRRIELSGRISRLGGELEGIRSQLSRGSALSQAKAVSGQSDRDALAGVNRKLTELQSQGFADGHPDIQRLLSERRALQKVVEDHLHADVTQFEKRSNVAYDSLQSQADQMEAQLRAARSELGFIEANRRSLRTVSNESPKVNARLDELLRMKEDAVRQHSLLFDRLKKAEIQLQLERVSASSRYEIAPARLDYPAGRMAFFTRLASGLGIGLLLAVLVLGIVELKRLFVRVARGTAAATVLFALFVAQGLGCAHNGNYVWVEDLPAKNQNSEPVIHPRDSLVVEVQKQPTLSGEFVVRDDGHYSQPMVGSIRVAGQTPSQAASAVSVALKDVVVAPVVSVWISKTTSIRVSVVGEVKTPGNYELTRDRGLLPALALAGWLTEFAHSDRIFVVRARTNERIRFRALDITTAEPQATQFQLADGDVLVVE